MRCHHGVWRITLVYISLKRYYHTGNRTNNISLFNMKDIFSRKRKRLENLFQLPRNSMEERAVPLNVPATDCKTVVPPDVPAIVPTAVPADVPVNVPKKPPRKSACAPAAVPITVPGTTHATSSNSAANSVANSAANSKEKINKRRAKRIKLGKRTSVSIRTYRKDPRVNIRDYICDIHGDRHALKRGILLTSEQWNVLKENIDVIDEGLKKRRVQ